MDIFIMAQGRGARWENDTLNGLEAPAKYKWLIPINGESILSRTIRQFSPWGHVCLIACEEIYTAIDASKIRVRTLREPGTIVSGICQTGNEWASPKGVLILLGDVIFGPKMRDFIVAKCTHQISQILVWGRSGPNLMIGKQAKEIFGLFIPPCMFSTALHEFKRLRGQPKLWSILDKIEILHPEFLSLHESWTDDIDSIIEYHVFGKKLIELAEREG